MPAEKSLKRVKDIRKKQRKQKKVKVPKAKEPMRRNPDALVRALAFSQEALLNAAVGAIGGPGAKGLLKKRREEMPDIKSRPSTERFVSKPPPPEIYDAIRAKPEPPPPVSPEESAEIAEQVDDIVGGKKGKSIAEKLKATAGRKRRVRIPIYGADVEHTKYAGEPELDEHPIYVVNLDDEGKPVEDEPREAFDSLVTDPEFLKQLKQVAKKVGAKEPQVREIPKPAGLAENLKRVLDHEASKKKVVDAIRDEARKGPSLYESEEPQNMVYEQDEERSQFYEDDWSMDGLDDLSELDESQEGINLTVEDDVLKDTDEFRFLEKQKKKGKHK